MDQPLVILAYVFAGLVLVFVVGALAMFKMFFHTVEQGQAMVITRRHHAMVSFTGGVVLPIINRYEVMDISLKTIEVDRQGTNGLVCQDNIRADIKVTFFVQVNKTEEDVLKVATAIGVARASDRKTIEDLFMAKFSEALKTVGKRMNFVDLYNQRDQFKDEIVKCIGRDLNGFSLENAAIDYIEQTPLKLLDPDNILDSEGRKKIIELTATQRVKANEIEREAQKTIKKQDVEAREAILALERQQCEAEARQVREIATTRAREQAEQTKVEAEEHRRSQQTKILVEQELAVQGQNAQREVQIAEKNREGAVMVENERIQKERQLEVVVRERAVELSGIEKEKMIAQERKAIAEVIRERIVVEKSVAEEEERIKSVRLVMEAQRKKDAALIAADQEAEQSKIMEVKLAESASIAATHRAKQQLTLADAEQASAEKTTLAAIRRAEGRQAESAAEGLAAARVKEADAIASEKQGLAAARVKEADAEAGKKLGLAQVTVKNAEADVIKRTGEAEASAVENRILAEAKGLHEKSAAMAKLTEATRGHEEFRLRLDKEYALRMSRVQADVKVAEQRSVVLATALKNAKFEIVGGDGQFFDRFVNAVSTGKSIDATVDNSEVLQAVGKDYLDGTRSLPEDLKDAAAGLGSQGLANLSIAALLTKLAHGKDPEKIKVLMAKARELGLVGAEKS